MKFILDTDKKTIQLQEDVNIEKLSDLLGKMFPNGEWKEYTLLRSVDIREVDRSQPITNPGFPANPLNPAPNPSLPPYSPQPIWYDNTNGYEWNVYVHSGTGWVAKDNNTLSVSNGTFSTDTAMLKDMEHTLTSDNTTEIGEELDCKDVNFANSSGTFYINAEEK